MNVELSENDVCVFIFFYVNKVVLPLVLLSVLIFDNIQPVNFVRL